MQPTKIPWCDQVWNPVTGCTPISTGCKNCYAKRTANRLAGRAGYPKENPFAVTFHPDRIYRPMDRKKPALVFVCSMGDLFHPDVELKLIYQVLAMISRGRVDIEAATAVINERICSGCQVCLMVCPYSAISFDEEKGVCRVNEALCKGCGTCVGSCTADAIDLSHFTNQQIVAQMEGILEL